MKLGKKLKQLREKSNLSQTDIAKKLNISRQAISSWEKGYSTPDIDNLVLLSNLYDFDLNKFLNDSLSWKEKISNEFKDYIIYSLHGYFCPSY